jgi:hypothetical protein
MDVPKPLLIVAFGKKITPHTPKQHLLLNNIQLSHNLIAKTMH